MLDKFAMYPEPERFICHQAARNAMATM